MFSDNLKVHSAFVLKVKHPHEAPILGLFDPEDEGASILRNVDKHVLV